jgi:hypothetical protein
MDVESAAAQLGEALALATELGMRPEIARCRVSLGRLHRQIGEVRTAREHLAAGAALFRELDAAFWAERAETEVGESR